MYAQFAGKGEAAAALITAVGLGLLVDGLVALEVADLREAFAARLLGGTQKHCATELIYGSSMEIFTSSGSDHARHLSNWCDICKLVKVVHGN